MANGMDNSSAVTSEPWSSNWNESSSSSAEKPHHQRSASYPLRRPHQTSSRPGETVAIVVADGLNHKDEVLDQNHSHHVNSVKCSGGSNRRTSLGEKASVPKIWKTSSTVYRILISLAAVFFLIQTVAHGFVFLLFRHTDLQAESLDIFPRVFGTELTTASGDDVRFVPRNVVERLLLSKGRATVAELRKETRSPVRLPRLALVCIHHFVCFSFITRNDFVQRAFL